jgi:hypothetical protein
MYIFPLFLDDTIATTIDIKNLDISLEIFDNFTQP